MTKKTEKNIRQLYNRSKLTERKKGVQGKNWNGAKSVRTDSSILKKSTASVREREKKKALRICCRVYVITCQTFPLKHCGTV